jgi:hypothetical protein
VWYIVLIAALYAIGYITLPSLQSWFREWLLVKRYGVKSMVVDKAEPEPPPAVEVPDQIVAYAKSWNTPWATDDCLERAKRLYVEHDRNWEVAYQELLKQDGEDK